MHPHTHYVNVTSFATFQWHCYPFIHSFQRNVTNITGGENLGRFSVNHLDDHLFTTDFVVTQEVQASGDSVLKRSFVKKADFVGLEGTCIQ
jgi:hypothetical protein